MAKTPEGQPIKMDIFETHSTMNSATSRFGHIDMTPPRVPNRELARMKARDAAAEKTLFALQDANPHLPKPPLNPKKS